MLFKIANIHDFKTLGQRAGVFVDKQHYYGIIALNKNFLGFFFRMIKYTNDLHTAWKSRWLIRREFLFSVHILILFSPLTPAPEPNIRSICCEGNCCLPWFNGSKELPFKMFTLFNHQFKWSTKCRITEISYSRSLSDGSKNVTTVTELVSWVVWL